MIERALARMRNRAKHGSSSVMSESSRGQLQAFFRDRLVGKKQRGQPQPKASLQREQRSNGLAAT